MSDDLKALDAACAKAMGWQPDPARCNVCGWPLEDGICEPGNCAERPVPKIKYNDPAPYSEEPYLASLLEDEIEKRGLQGAYIHALWNELDGAPLVDGCTQQTASDWALLRATPGQRARAFLAAVEAG